MQPEQPTGRLLIKAFRHFETEVLVRLEEAGISDITMSHLNVLRHLDPGGLRLSELASEAGLTKQAIGKIANDLAAKGYLAIETDADDARAKRVIYTDEGHRLVQTAVDIIRQMEDEYAMLLGEGGYQTLRELLIILIERHPRKPYASPSLR